MRNLIWCACTLLLAAGVNAQDGLVKRADKAFSRMAYAVAIPLYERASTVGASDASFARQLATSYRKIRDPRNAEIWYARAVQLPEADPTDLYYYSEALRSNGKFKQADEWMKKYEDQVPADSRVDRQGNSIRYTDKLMNDGLPGCQIQLLNANTEGQDMGGSFNGERLVFASNRTPAVAAKNTHTWNNARFLDLYCGKVEADGQISDIYEHAPYINSRFHESNAVFTDDGKTMWFTRNNFYRGSVNRTSEGVNNLKIFYSEYMNNDWSKEKNFPHNSNEYSVGHPTFSDGGYTMYFTSDMPGGMGGTDIFVCTRTSGGWSQPKNMGSAINTEGDEMFPFIHSSGVLYFASNGHRGFGGLDNFAAKIVDSKVTDVKNVGAPINSGADDFSLVFDASGTKGYFTSNRTSGMGGDDIYHVTTEAPIAFELFVQGKVTAEEDGSILPNTKVKLVDGNGKTLDADITNDQGEYKFLIEPDGEYYILAEGQGREKVKENFSSKGISGGVIRKDVVMPEAPPFSIWTHVTDGKTNAPLQDVEVNIVDNKGNRVTLDKTDASGNVRKALPDIQVGDQISYKVTLKKEDYFPKIATFSHRIDEPGEMAIHEMLDMNMEKMEVGVDVGKAINIDPIYFDLGKSSIRKDAAAELDKIVEVMKEYPKMQIELGSHTDSRGSASGNMRLSDRRAKSSAKYIVSKGISSDRITGKGYGETSLQNKCKDGVKCTEEEHQLNRRTEFIVVKM